MSSVLIIEDDVTFALMLSTWLSKKNLEVKTATSVKEGKQQLLSGTFDLILSDLRLPDGDGLEILHWIKAQSLSVPFIMMTVHADVKTAVQSIKSGASDYIIKPVNPEELWQKMNEALHPFENIARGKKTEKNNSAGNEAKGNFVSGKSPAALQLFEHARLVAPTDISVLITGASGTGKEYVARFIHEQSNRKDAPFIAVDCGAIPKDLAASEFFGHIKGSFTGAIENKTGAFAAAQGGTIFLDEIGNLTYEIQIQLLRALQERKIRPIGSNRETAIDIRLISATNEDLRAAISDGGFREDLYHRLNEFTIRMPELKDRKEDFILFADHFLKQANKKLHKDIRGFDAEAMQLLVNYDWPGNLRQLNNVIRYAALLSSGTHITPKELPEEIKESPKENIPAAISLKDEAHERELILKALKESGNNKTKASRLLGVDRKTLYNKMKLYKLD